MRTKELRELLEISKEFGTVEDNEILVNYLIEDQKQSEHGEHLMWTIIAMGFVFMIGWTLRGI